MARLPSEPARPERSDLSARSDSATVTPRPGWLLEDCDACSVFRRSGQRSRHRDRRSRGRSVGQVDAAADARRQARPPGHVYVRHDHATAAAAALNGKDVLTPEEAAAFDASENKRLNRDLYDPEKGQPSAGYPPRSQGGVLSYNDFWYERGDQLTADRRTSLIVDPADGRIPFSAATRTRMAERAARTNAGVFDDPEDLSLVDRCILGFNSGPPMISGTYNNNLQIVQTPGYVDDPQRDGPQRADHPD